MTIAKLFAFRFIFTIQVASLQNIMRICCEELIRNYFSNRIQVCNATIRMYSNFYRA